MSSKRQYATIAEVEEFADITSTNDVEFEDRISQCEAILDAYLGFQEKFIADEVIGNISSLLSPNKIVDGNYNSRLAVTDDYFTFCYVEIIGGPGVGNVRRISASSYSEKSITYDGNDIGAEVGSVFRIYQLGKFPRDRDAHLNSLDNKWYKSIPLALREAVAAQMEFLIAQGDEYFAGEASTLQSESIGNYSYSKGGASEAQSSAVKMVSPKARTLLRGYKNSTGRLVDDNPTRL